MTQQQPKDPAERESFERDRAGSKPAGRVDTAEKALNESGQGQGQSAGRPQTQPQE
jgi:hypothetical protein